MNPLTALVSALAMAITLPLAGCSKKDEAADLPKPEKIEPRPAPAPVETAPPAQPPPGDVKIAGAGAGFPECESYLRTYERYMACDKVPQDAKDLARPQIDALRQSCTTLSNPNLPPEIRKSYAGTYKDGERTLRDAAAKLGCAL